MKIKKFTAQDGIKARAHRKENSFQNSFILVVKTKNEENKDELREIADLRIYGTQAMNYCCLWVHDRKNGIYASGSGSAGGYGYHRPSAAAAEAIEKAGIELSQEIDGRGDSAIEQALNALAKHLNYKTYLVIKAHA